MTKQEQYWTLNGGFGAMYRVIEILHQGKFNTTAELKDILMGEIENIHALMTELEEETGINQAH